MGRKHPLFAHPKYKMITIFRVLRIREDIRLAQTGERRGYEESTRMCAARESQLPLTCRVTLGTSSQCPELLLFPRARITRLPQVL